MNFAYTERTIDALEGTLSSDRLSKYLELASENKEQALILYVKNTRLSEAFYTPLQGIEVCLRNAVHRSLVNLRGEDWHEPGVAPLQYPLTEMIEKAKASLRAGRKDITPGRVVAELSFGFWVSILGPRYETTLWRPALRHAFPNRPRGVERKQVQGTLNVVRRLRNRIAHHERILHRDLDSDHELIIRAISWTCRYTARWVRAHSRFPGASSN